MKKLKQFEEVYIKKLFYCLNKLQKTAKEVNKDIGVSLKLFRFDDNNSTLLNFLISYKRYNVFVIRLKDYWEDEDIIEFQIIEQHIIEDGYDVLSDVNKIFEKVAKCEIEVNKK